MAVRPAPDVHHLYYAYYIPESNPAFDNDAPDPDSSYAPYWVYNIGNHQPVELMTFIQTIERTLGIEVKKNFLPMQSGDVIATCADVEALKHDVRSLYKRARAGEIPAYTGISSLHEPPERPECIINTAEQTQTECMTQIIESLVAHRVLTIQKLAFAIS